MDEWEETANAHVRKRWREKTKKENVKKRAINMGLTQQTCFANWLHGNARILRPWDSAKVISSSTSCI